MILRSTLTMTLAAAFAMAGPLAAQETGNLRNDPGRAIAERLAARIDRNGDGRIDEAEIRAASAEALASIDADGDGRMTPGELLDWPLGMADLAAFRGRSGSYETAMAIVFNIFDRDGDGIVSGAEHEAAVMHSYAYADLDGDGVLTTGEYLGGFIFNVVMRNATVEPGLRFPEPE